MKFNKMIALAALLLALCLSMGMVAAGENNTADNTVLESDSNLMEVNEGEYNANMVIEQSCYIDDHFDINIRVNDEYSEKVGDANVFLDNTRNADTIDENNIYHFYINTDGIHNFTLDDGKYRASPLSISINPPSNPNQNNGADEVDDEDEAVKKITLFSEDVTIYYDEVTVEIMVEALDEDEEPVSGLNLLMDGEYEPDYVYDDGYCFCFDYLPVGTHYFEFSLNEEDYSAEPIIVEVNVLKSTPTVTAKKWYSTQNQYVTLRAEIEDKDQSHWIDEGTVTFKINGKSYTVEVEGGEATKKVKINKAGTFTYTATFKSSNHYTKTATSKVVVYSTSKKARTFSIGKYKVVVPVSKYNKLVNAKNTNKLVSFEVKTNKYVKQTVGNPQTISKWVLHKKNTFPYGYYYNRKVYKIKNYRKIWIDEGVYDLRADIYKKVTITKKVTKTVNARVYFVISYGGKNGGQTGPAGKYCLYVTTPYQNPGYDICKPCVSGMKISSEISTLNKAKTKN